MSSGTKRAKPNNSGKRQKSAQKNVAKRQKSKFGILISLDDK